MPLGWRQTASDFKADPSMALAPASSAASNVPPVPPITAAAQSESDFAAVFARVGVQQAREAAAAPVVRREVPKAVSPPSKHILSDAPVIAVRPSATAKGMPAIVTKPQSAAVLVTGAASPLPTAGQPTNSSLVTAPSVEPADPPPASPSLVLTPGEAVPPTLAPVNDADGMLQARKHPDQPELSPDAPTGSSSVAPAAP
jgi:hypothetical protein